MNKECLSSFMMGSNVFSSPNHLFNIRLVFIDTHELKKKFKDILISISSVPVYNCLRSNSQRRQSQSKHFKNRDVTILICIS